LIGAESLGNALHYNTTLKVLNVSQNNITPRAAFTLLSGIKSCSSLEFVKLAGNPIGEAGAKKVLNMNINEGYRLNLDMTNCPTKVYDASCWFDPDDIGSKTYVLHLDKHYHRTVYIELLRMTASDKSVSILSCHYTSVNENIELDFKLYDYEVDHIDKNLFDDERSKSDVEQNWCKITTDN
jgi:hypothetical protein